MRLPQIGLAFLPNELASNFDCTEADPSFVVPSEDEAAGIRRQPVRLLPARPPELPIVGGWLLPEVVLSLQRKSRQSRGYFLAGSYLERDSGERADKIALNPDFFADQPEKTLATLSHEACHLWQLHSGDTGRRHYHNRGFALRMLEIGLQPRDTGDPGDKTTGQHMEHRLPKVHLLSVARSFWPRVGASVNQQLLHRKKRTIAKSPRTIAGGGGVGLPWLFS